MPRTALLSALALLLAATAPSAVAAEEMHKVVVPDSVDWQPAPPVVPKGAMMSVLAGDPAKTDMYVLRLKLPANYSIAPHWHSNAENLTVISGMLQVGLGDMFDKSKGQALPPGGFVFLPSPMHHYAWSTTETIIQISGMGPFDINYVNPKDNPQASATTATTTGTK